jgi:hypothetical protein
MSASNDPFAALSQQISGQGQGQNTAPAPDTSGDPFAAIAATLPPTNPPANGPWYDVNNEHNLQQLGDAAIGAGKSIVKGLGVVGDVATLGLTHLLPGSDKASAGINAPGHALDASNTDQKYGSYVGDAATFELGSGIMDSLSHLPLAERMIQAAKALKVAQEHPVIAAVAGNALKAAATTAAGTLTATGDPTKAAESAPLGAVVGAASEGIPALYRSLTGADIQPVLQKGVREALGNVADEVGVPAGEPASIRDVAQTVGDNTLAKSKDLYSQVDTATGGRFSPLNDALVNVNKEIRNTIGLSDEGDAKLLARKADLETKMDSVFDTARQNGVSEQTITDAKDSYKKAQALYDLDSQIKASTKGMRPNLAKAKGTPETVDPTKLSLRLNKLYDSGRLQQAVGDTMAETLLQHSDAAERAARQVKTLKTARNAVGAIVGTGAVGGGAVEGLKHVLGGKH